MNVQRKPAWQIKWIKLNDVEGGKQTQKKQNPRENKKHNTHTESAKK